MNIRDEVEHAYKMLPPPLSALPAKYRAPISLLVHSLSAGIVSEKLAELIELYDLKEPLFFLALTHDIHQKLIGDGLATLKTAKKYIREKLDELGKLEYYKYIDNAIDIDACGKNQPIRGLPKEASLICHVADMAQGSLEGTELLYWLESQVRELHRDLRVRFYSIMIPQVFARSYIMWKVYQKYIADRDHLALASPWGLYVVTYEDELPEVLKISWDDLRINTELVSYEEIKKVEASGASASITNIKITGNEAKKRLWSRFARMFYSAHLLGGDSPIYPVLPEEVKGLFVNIEFTDVEFRNLNNENTHTCALCGLQHLAEQSLVTNMFPKIAGVKVTTEKWNRFMPAHIKVKAWDSLGQWRNKIGLCPLCTLEAIAIRKSRFVGKLTGVLTATISKPVPIRLLTYLGRVLVESSRSLNKDKDIPIVAEGTPERLLLDYSSATIGTQEVSEPKIENLFRHENADGVFERIGKLLYWGIYPVKFLQSIDTSIVDKPVVTPYNFAVLDFPVTSKKHGRFLPWVACLLRTLGRMEKSKALHYLDFRPEHAPLALLALDKSQYDYVSGLFSRIGG